MERLTEYESIAGHAHAIITGDLDKAAPCLTKMLEQNRTLLPAFFPEL